MSLMIIDSAPAVTRSPLPSTTLTSCAWQLRIGKLALRLTEVLSEFFNEPRLFFTGDFHELQK
jgi:hypothetical protein